MNAIAQYKNDVFISYSQADQAWVQSKLLPRLEETGIRYIDQQRFELGRPKLDEIEQAIVGARRTLLILSPSYLSDTWRQFDSILASSYGLAIGEWPAIPVIIQPCALPYRLNALVSVDLSDADEIEWQRLVATLSAVTKQEYTPDAVLKRRRIDAATPSCAEVGKCIDLFVQIRFPNSPLLGIKDWPTKQKPASIEQASEPVSLAFPRDRRTGKLGSIYLVTRIVAPDFVIEGAAQHRVEVLPDRYSRRIAFLLTAVKTGNCRINVEIYNIDYVYLGTIPVETTIGGVTSDLTATVANLLLIVTAAEKASGYFAARVIEQEPVMPDDPKPRREMRETDVVKALRSTSFGKHPTAFFNTQLPVLQIALNSETMTTNMAELLQPLARSGATPTISYAKLLAYKQGNRGLIHYEVTGTTLGETCIVYGKLYPDLNQAERVNQTMQALWSDVYSAGTGQVGVPRALGCLPELSMLVYIPVEGEFLGDAMASDQALRYMDLAGTWLGALHRGKLPLDRRFNVGNELVNLQAWSALVGHKYPGQAEAASRIAARLKELAGELHFDIETPIHKDFHYGHIVVDGGLKVIDFDEMRLGDPNFDLAHFCANLHLLAYRLNNSAFQFSSLQSTFLTAYSRVTGWVPNDQFIYFYAYTCLKIAKQLCSMRGLRPRPEGEEQQRQVQLMLDQGVGALPSTTAKKLASKFATMVVDSLGKPPNDT